MKHRSQAAMLHPPKRAMRHRLVKVATIPGIMADAYLVEGTDRHVLELLMFGFACASRYIQLRRSIRLERFDDAHFMADVGVHPSKYGRILRFDVDLFLDDSDQSLSVELR
jgi:hypothetical protein